MENRSTFSKNIENGNWIRWTPYVRNRKTEITNTLPTPGNRKSDLCDSVYLPGNGKWKSDLRQMDSLCKKPENRNHQHTTNPRKPEIGSSSNNGLRTHRKWKPEREVH
jgi:hypothetical protein